MNDLNLERERLRFERQKAAMEFRLKRLELVKRKDTSWKDIFTNPLTLAIVGGFIGIMTTVISNALTTSANIAAETSKSREVRETAKQTLQADLIKKFVDGSVPTVRENLSFLVQAGLLPEYADGIQAYLKQNPEAAPQVGPPPSSPRKVYLIFFDWDKDVLTPEASNNLQQAAALWKAQGGQLQVTGYTDRSLPPSESQRLSERMANNVAKALQEFGIPQSKMSVLGRGENDNRVPTEPGVREPQNRRVEILFE